MLEKFNKQKMEDLAVLESLHDILCRLDRYIDDAHSIDQAASGAI